MSKSYTPSPEALKAFGLKFKIITPEQGMPWLKSWDSANSMTPESIMALLEELAEYKKLIKSYDAMINAHPDKIILMNILPNYYNAVDKN